MRAPFSKKLVTAITGIVLLGGAGGAIAATQGSSDGLRQAYLNDLANKLGVSSTTLTNDMKAALEDQISAAVAAGKLTPAQGDALKQRIEQSNGLPLIGGGFAHGGLGLGLRGGGLRVGLSAAAQYLGVSEATLRSDLAAGKSLAQITTSIPDKSLSELESAITAAAKTRLDQAVSGGRITSQQEQQYLSNLSSELGSLVQRTWTGGGGVGALFGRRGFWRDGGGAYGGGTSTSTSQGLLRTL